MPHSSGGGGGSFHGGSSYRSGGSHSSSSSSEPVPHISRHRTSHTKHRYVYYRGHHPYYLYSDRPISNSDYTEPGVTISVVILTLSIILGFICLGFSYRFKPDKVKMNYSQQEVIIDDELNVIKDQHLYEEMVEFQQQTGITPAFKSLEYSTNKYDLENYAFDAYVSTFEDEKHWLIVYSEQSNDWYFIGMQGDDTDGVIDDYVKDQFNNRVVEIMSKTEDPNYSFSQAFEEMNSYVMYKGITHPILFRIGVVSLVLAVLSIVSLVYFSNRNSKRVLYTIPEKSEDGVTEFCPSCHGEFVAGMHTNCPYCGTSLYNYSSYEDKNQTY